MWTTGVLLVLTHQLSQDKEHTFHFGDPWVNEVRLSPPLFFFFSPVFDGQWLGKMMIHWYPLDFWVIFRQNQVSHWIQIGWSRLDEEKGSQPVFYAYPLGDDMKGILNCNIRWFGNRCQQCLMFVFFNLSWVSWRRTSSTKNPLRLHKSSSSSR